MTMVQGAEARGKVAHGVVSNSTISNSTKAADEGAGEVSVEDRPASLFQAALWNELSHLKIISLPSFISAATLLVTTHVVTSASKSRIGAYPFVTASSLTLWLFAILHNVDTIKNAATRRAQLQNWLFGLLCASSFYAVISISLPFSLWFFPASLFVYYETMFIAVGIRNGFSHSKFSLPLIVVPGLSCCLSAVLFYVYVTRRGASYGGEYAVFAGSSVVYPLIRTFLRAFFLSVVAKRLNSKVVGTEEEVQEGGGKGEEEKLIRTYGTLARALSMNFSTPGTAMLATVASLRVFSLGRMMEGAIELSATEVVLRLRRKGIVRGLKSTSIKPVEENRGKEEQTGENRAEEFSRNAIEVRLAQEDVGEKAAVVVAVLAGMLGVNTFGEDESFGKWEITLRLVLALAIEVSWDVLKFVRSDRHGLRLDRHAIGGLEANTVGQIVLASLCICFTLHAGFALFY